MFDSRPSVSRMMGWALFPIALIVTASQAWEMLAPLPGGEVSQYLKAGNRKLILTAAGVHMREPGQPTWTSLELPCQDPVAGLHVFGNAVLADAYTGHACLSQDGGRTWKSVDLAPVRLSPDISIIVSHFGPHGLYALAPDPDFVLFRSPDTGRTWTRLSPAIYPVNLVDAGPGFLVSTWEGGVYRMDPATGRLTSASAGLTLAADAPYTLAGNAAGVILAGNGAVGPGVYRYLRASNRWESALPDMGISFPRLAMEGSRVFMVVRESPDSASILRSLDGGETWQRQPPTENPAGDVWVEGDTLIYGTPSASLVRREWSSRTETRWDHGINATAPRKIQLHGNGLYMTAESFSGYRRTWDRGATWEALVSDSTSEDLHITGNQAYLIGPRYLDRIDPTGPGRHRLAYPPMDHPIHQFIDAGDRFYARFSYSIGPPGNHFHILHSTPKNPILWGENLAIPFPYAHTLDASGGTLVATYQDSLAFSKDGGKTWTRLSGHPFRISPLRPAAFDNVYRVDWEGGEWSLWDGIALFRAADPAGTWSRMPAPLDTVLEYRLSGRRVLAWAPGEAHLSSDRGRTWKPLSFPIPPDMVVLSDSMVCVNSLADTRCLELDPLPVGAAPRWIRMTRGKPTWVRQSGRVVIRNPQGGGAVTLHGLDGRTLMPLAR